MSLKVERVIYIVGCAQKEVKESDNFRYNYHEGVSDDRRQQDCDDHDVDHVRESIQYYTKVRGRHTIDDEPNNKLSSRISHEGFQSNTDICTANNCEEDLGKDRTTIKPDRNT